MSIDTREQMIAERGDKIARAINEAVGNDRNKTNPVGFYVIHFEFMNPDGSVGTITNANNEDVSYILREILRRTTH